MKNIRNVTCCRDGRT